MTAYVASDSKVTVSIEGSPSVDYVFPSFADALYTPVLGPEKDHCLTQAYNLSSMFDTVQTNLDSQSCMNESYTGLITN